MGQLLSRNRRRSQRGSQNVQVPALPSPRTARSPPTRVGIHRRDLRDVCAPAQPWPDTMRTTDTICNDLNLRKPSLIAVADPVHPERYHISFTFDSNIPCTVAVFFLASENEPDIWKGGGKRCALTRLVTV